MALLWKMSCNLGNPMSLRHPLVRVFKLMWCVIWLLHMCRVPTSPCLHMCDMTSSHVWHDSLSSYICVTCRVPKSPCLHCVTRLFHMCDMTLFYHIYVWHVGSQQVRGFIYVTWRPHLCDMTPSYEWHASFICVTCLLSIIYICDMYGAINIGHFCEKWPKIRGQRILAFISVTWPPHLCDVTPFYMPLHRRGLLRVTWLLQIYDTAASCVWHDSFRYVTWPLCMCDMNPSYMWHAWSICVTRLLHTCDMTSAVVWHNSFRCVTCLLHMCKFFPSYVWRDSFICVTWLVQIFDMTPSYLWHDSFICVAWLLHVCDMTPSYVWHDSFRYLTWLLHVCDVTPSYVCHDSLHMCDINPLYVRHDSFTCVPEVRTSSMRLRYSICVTWLIHMCDMTPSYVCHDSFIWMDLKGLIHDLHG